MRFARQGDEQPRPKANPTKLNSAQLIRRQLQLRHASFSKLFSHPPRLLSLSKLQYVQCFLASEFQMQHNVARIFFTLPKDATGGHLENYIWNSRPGPESESGPEPVASTATCCPTPSTLTAFRVLPMLIEVPSVCVKGKHKTRDTNGKTEREKENSSRYLTYMGRHKNKLHVQGMFGQRRGAPARVLLKRLYVQKL